MSDLELEKNIPSKKQRITTKKNGEESVRAGFTSATTFEMFKAWFDQKEFDKGFYYCGTINEQSPELYNLRPQTSRGGW